MKLKEGFVLRKMPGMNIVMPVGTTAKDFRKTVVLNDTAAFIFELFQNGETVDTVPSKLTEIYDIDLETAERAVKTTVENLIGAGLADV